MAQYKIDITATTRDANAKISALSTKLDRIKRPNVNFGGITSGAKGAALAVGGIATAFAGVSVAIAAASKGIDIMRSSLDAFANRESIGVSLSALLGSDIKGAAKLDELNKIASNTPLALNDIATSYKSMLATLGEDDATTKLFVSIGDAAALTVDNIDNMGNHLQVVTRHVTRAMAAIKNGLSFGTELQELSTLGILQGDILTRLRNVSAGKITMSKDDSTALLLSGLQRFSGGMVQLSQTVGGKMSTLSDAIENLKVVFASGFANQFKDIVDSITKVLDSNSVKDTIESFGDMLGTRMTTLFDTLQRSISEINFEKFGDNMFDAINALANALPLLVSVLGKLSASLGSSLNILDTNPNSDTNIGLAKYRLMLEGKPITDENIKKMTHAVHDSGILGSLSNLATVPLMGAHALANLPEAISYSNAGEDYRRIDEAYGKLSKLDWSWTDSIDKANYAWYDSNAYDYMRNLATGMLDGDNRERLGYNDVLKYSGITQRNYETTQSYADMIRLDEVNSKLHAMGIDFGKSIILELRAGIKEADKLAYTDMMRAVKGFTSTVINGGVQSQRATDPTVTQALNAVVQSLQASGSVGASIGNGYGNILSPTDVIRNMQQQTLDVNHMQLSVQQQILAKITDLDKSNNLASIVFQ